MASRSELLVYGNLLPPLMGAISATLETTCLVAWLEDQRTLTLDAELYTVNRAPCFPA